MKGLSSTRTARGKVFSENDPAPVIHLVGRGRGTRTRTLREDATGVTEGLVVFLGTIVATAVVVGGLLFAAAAGHEGGPSAASGESPTRRHLDATDASAHRMETGEEAVSPAA